MEFVQLFVEDELNEAYEILAARALELPVKPSSARRRHVRAARLDLNEFTSRDSLLDSVQRAHRAGSRCVLFIMDAEDAHFSPDRAAKITDFGHAFAGLCDYLGSLPNRNPLKGIMVTRIVNHSCLECWLLADPLAIVQAFGGEDYAPSRQNTANLSPKQARDQIAHIMREVGRRSGNRKLMRVSGSNIKSEGIRIAAHLTPQHAQHNNFSLRYFFDMISCTQSGCTQPFPNPV
jgi:hypothetical protein